MFDWENFLKLIALHGTRIILVCIRIILVCIRSTRSVAGVMVSIVAFQAVDPGSIPGRRIFIGGPNELKFLNVPRTLGPILTQCRCLSYIILFVNK